MKTRTKVLVLSLFALAGMAVAAFSVRIVRRERARASFSGCNALQVNLATLELLMAQDALKEAEQNTNTPIENLAALQQRFEKADARLREWKAHAKKYGHSHGTANHRQK